MNSFRTWRSKLLSFHHINITETNSTDTELLTQDYISSTYQLTEKSHCTWQNDNLLQFISTTPWVHLRSRSSLSCHPPDKSCRQLRKSYEHSYQSHFARTRWIETSFRLPSKKKNASCALHKMSRSGHPSLKTPLSDLKFSNTHNDN